jgi:hypothetical protein
MEETTFLEEFLSSLELLPNDTRRDFELMREYDKDAMDSTRELAEMEQKFLEKIETLKKQGTYSEDDRAELAPSMDEILALRARVKQRISQKKVIAANVMKDLERFVRKLDTDLAFFETELRGFGEFELLARGVEPGSDVAINLYPDGEIVLGRVVTYHADLGMYDIADVDDDSKQYHLPESNVIMLDLAESSQKLSKGEEVLAVYPDTTSFYPAIVTQVPRRAATGQEPLVNVQFLGDADDSGSTPHRQISLKSVIRTPTGWLKS